MPQYDTLREYNAALRRREVFDRVREIGNTEWKLPPRDMLAIAKKWGVSRTSIYNDLKLISRMPQAPPQPSGPPPQRKQQKPKPKAEVHTLQIMPGGKVGYKPPTPSNIGPDLPEHRPITDPFDFSVALETGEGTVFSELTHTERLNFIAQMAAHLITSPFSNGSLKSKGIDTLVKVTEQMRSTSTDVRTASPATADAARERLRQLTEKLPPAMRERLQNVG